MRIIKLTLSVICIVTALTSKGQLATLNKFSSFVGKNYKIPDTIKYDCNWNYAIVKCTIRNNVIVKYECVNNVTKQLSDSFKYLIGYKFNGVFNHNLLFYLSFDNIAVCKPNGSDRRYLPNEVLKDVSNYMNHERAKDRHLIVLPEPIILGYAPQQH